MLIKLNTVLAGILLLVTPLIAQQQSSANTKILINSFSTDKNFVIPLGVLIELEKGWHIYWRNSGDSGMPTIIEFELPEGVTAGEIIWPSPKAFEYEGLASYGYDNKVLLLSDLTVPESYKQKKLPITVNVKSLICKDVCIPYNSTTSIEIDLNKNFNAAKEVSMLFTKTKTTLPVTNHIIQVAVLPFEDYVVLSFNSPQVAFNEIQKVYFLPYENGIFKNTIEQRFNISEEAIELDLEYDHFKTTEFTQLFGILVLELDDLNKKVYEIKKKLN